MTLLCANHSSRAFHALAHAHPGRLGWLIGPRGWKTPRQHLPYALDNDAFTCWRKSLPFDVAAWRKMLEKATRHSQKPMWVLVPDVVADRERTIEAWHKFKSTASEIGSPLAFAVQDGMRIDDVPKDASVVFVGGTTDWKWKTAPIWTTHFPRVHIGRTNGIRRLWIAQGLGAESCDGTGYFRATINGLEGRKLKAWLHHRTDPQYELSLA